MLGRRGVRRHAPDVAAVGNRRLEQADRPGRRSLRAVALSRSSRSSRSASKTMQRHEPTAFGTVAVLISEDANVAGNGLEQSQGVR